jgi:aminoglycoside phosphotransferase (APT) family kinase protein
VKWVRTGPAQSRTEPWRLRTELASLRFLSDDLGLALALALSPSAYRQDSSSWKTSRPVSPWTSSSAAMGAAAHLGPLAAFARPRWVTRRAGSPGPFLALSHGDAESNNILVRESGPADARLIDFEAAGYAHALIDAVCLHVPGPGWIRVGDPGDTSLADQYRRALARGMPEAQDDRRYGFALAAACMSWALLRLHRFAVLDTRAAGDRSRLQLVETLESAARTAEAHRALPHLAGWVRRTAGVLRRRWPDADLDPGDWAKFPPYSPRR